MVTRERILTEQQGPSRAGSGRSIKIVLICLLIAAGIVGAILIANFVMMHSTDRARDGVTISGVDVSLMNKDQILNATAHVSEDLLANADVSISFNGQVSKFTAQDLGLTTDYDSVVDQAIAYGHSDADTKETAGGPSLTVHIVADKAKIKAILEPIAQKYDKAPVDATATFMPWGYLSDGSAYTPEPESIQKSAGDSKALDEPSGLVRLTDSQMPNKLRYEYWQNKKYIEGYIPKDANVSRFLYKDSQTGSTIDLDKLIDQVLAHAQKGDMATIEAPITELQPKVSLDTLKKETQLVASWTSSYSNHLNYNRNWNVAKLSGLINGVVIQPGQTWSINDTTGKRTTSNGWLEAPGIELGGFTMQAGGGVCQISSTLYNASIRSNLTIVDASHHSISSDYIPLGLDATISSGGPDEKIKNPNSTPVYIVSYINPVDHNVTVEIYGEPVHDDNYGDVILDFNFLDGGTFGTAGMAYVYNTAVTPDGKQLAAGQSYVYAQARLGRSARTFKYFLSPTGEQLDVVSFANYSWNPINGTTYVNGPPPDAATLAAQNAAGTITGSTATGVSTSTTTTDDAPKAPNAKS